MRVRKPRRVYLGPGCAKDAANRANIAGLETDQSVVEDTNSILTAIYDTARRLVCREVIGRYSYVKPYWL